jgi:HSP20 family protein
MTNPSTTQNQQDIQNQQDTQGKPDIQSQQRGQQPAVRDRETGMQRRDQRMQRWDPFAMFDDMQREMMQLWNQTWPFTSMPRFQPTRRSWQMPTQQWMPTVDVYEQDNSLVVKAELPGVKKEDIDVELEQGDLVIRGQRRSEQEVRDENYYRSERSFGSFYRRLPLPEGVKPNQINASFNDGVLEIHIPKPAEQQQPERKKISVR